jgi:hypothetical protein
MYCFMPIITTAQLVEIGGWWLEVSLGKNVSKTLSNKISQVCK